MNTSKISDKGVCILGGGGLGDLTVIYPLLSSFEKEGIRYCYCTKVMHAKPLIESFIPSRDIFFLKGGLLSILNTVLFLRKNFHYTYIGPHPSLSTKLLAFFIGKPILSYSIENKSRFIGDTVKNDILRLGLKAPKKPYNKFFINPEIKRKPYILIHKSAKRDWQTTRWPDDNWRQLLNKLLANSEYDFVITGANCEVNDLKNFLSLIDPKFYDRATYHINNSIEDIFSLVNNAEGVICHNSGIMHVANVAEKRTVVITGSSALFWRINEDRVINVTSNECDAMCNKYRCPKDGYDSKCIKSISVDSAYEAINNLFFNGNV